MADYDEYPLQDEYLQRRQVLQQAQQPRPQQPLPQSPQQPGMIEQYGPLVGSAVMAYLNAIASPKAGGVGNAIRNAAVGGVNAYQTFGGMAQDAQKRRAQAEALAQLPEKAQMWGKAGAPMGVLATEDFKQQAGKAQNAALATVARSYVENPQVPDLQRAAAQAWIPVLEDPNTPPQKETILAQIHMGQGPKEAAPIQSTVMEGGKPTRKLFDREGKPIATLGEAPPVQAQVTAQRGREDADEIAGAIMEGTQPPDLTRLYHLAGPVRAKLAHEDYDLTTASRDWQAIQKHIATLNGPQQERLRQAIQFSYDSLDKIDELANQWKKLGGQSGYRVLNKAALAASKQVPGELGAVATTLEAQINDLTSEMAVVYKGGNASTDESLKLAANNLQADFNEEQFKKSMDLLRNNLRLRRNSILQSQPVGVSPGSIYAAPPTAPEQAPAAGAPAQAAPGSAPAPAGGGGIDLGDGFRLEPR